MAQDSNITRFDRNLAVVIGIDNYGNGVPPLRTAANDARELARVLRDEHGYEQVWEFIDPICTDKTCHPTATRNKLEDFLEKTLLAEVQENHRLLFYFAGHGIALNGDDGPQGYLISQDAKLGDVSTYLPMPKVEKALTQLSCRHCLIIMDCCFAGAFRWSSTRKLVPIPEVIHKEQFDRFIQYPAWQVITSASYDQFAWDNLELKDDRGTDPTKKHHSPFAAALFEALTGSADAYPAAKDDQPAGDGVITATELYLYLRGYVEEATENSIRQTPGLWSLKKHDKGEYIFLPSGHELNLPDAPSLDEVLKDETKNPYRGLQSYEKQHTHLFFGRTKLIEKLCDRVCDRSLTLVLGASGSGKSSLVKAGLVPHLEQAEQALQKKGRKQKLESEAHPHQHQHQQWKILPPFRPGETPLKALYSALRDKESPLAEHLPSLAEFTSQMLIDAIACWSQQYSDSKPKLLLIVDQFEELVTLCRNDHSRSQFLQVLIDSLAAYPEQLKIVLTLRSDFEPQLRDGFEAKLKQNQMLAPLLQAQLGARQKVEQKPKVGKNLVKPGSPYTTQTVYDAPPLTRRGLPGFTGLHASVLSNQQNDEQKPQVFWNQARFIVPAMTREELREVIEEPASAKVVFFKPDSLVEQLIDEVTGMPGALPLLSFALSELYLKLAKRYYEAKFEVQKEEKIIERAITQKDYEELGGVARSLTQRADQEYEALVAQDPAYAQTIKHVMLRMVAASGGELARRRVPLTELVYPEPENQRVKKVIQRFAAARLLVSGKDTEEQSYVEPAARCFSAGMAKSTGVEAR